MSQDSTASNSAAARRPKRRWQNLALAIVTFGLCGVIFEIALRVAGYGNLEIYDPDPKLYWRLKPNQDCFTKIGRQPVRINSQGLRGPEFDPDKPADVLRVLSLGDSRTFGWGLADAETYSRRLGSLLQEKIGAARRVEVLNAGVNAWSYPQMLVYFRNVAARYQPDWVILAEANLWTQFSERNSPEFVRKFLWRVRLKNLLRRSAIYHFVVEVQLREFYQRQRTRFIPVDPGQDDLFKEQQQGDPDAVFREAMAELCRVAATNGVRPMLMFLPTLDDLGSTNLSRVLVAKRAVSEELAVPLVDMTSDLRGSGNTLYLEADPVHLNARGNEIVARRLSEAMTRQLAP